MPSVDIKIKNADQIRRAYAKAPELMTKRMSVAVRKVLFIIQGAATKRANVKTGRLRASAYSVFSGLKGETGFKANYAAAVHDGSKPHVIEARFKKALFWDGAANPVRRVFHPGYKGNPFLSDAVDAEERRIDDVFTKTTQGVLDEIGGMA